MFCFVVKQKTAYEMRISDWSSDVCSSDLQLVKMRNRGTGQQDVFQLERISQLVKIAPRANGAYGTFQLERISQLVKITRARPPPRMLFQLERISQLVKINFIV